MSIYLTGDLHGTLDIERFSDEAWLLRDWRPTPDDILIVLGDVGCVYHTKPWDLPDLDTRDEAVVNTLRKFPWTVLFIDGNHENHATLADMEVKSWCGGLVHVVDDKLYHLMRGQVFNIDGLKVFAMGGAHSLDWAYRTPNESWWEDEMPSADEYDTALENLARHHQQVDVVLTHTCPSFLIAEIVDGVEFAQADELTDFLNELYDEIEFKTWAFAHFHEDIDAFSDDRFRCLFESIVRLDTQSAQLDGLD